jgi:hypothetical protein
MSARVQRTLVESRHVYRWAKDDYLPGSSTLVSLFDPWAPSRLPKKEPPSEAAPVLNETPFSDGADRSPEDFWFDLPVEPATEDPPLLGWDFARLPHFDPLINRYKGIYDRFDEPLRRGGKFKAWAVANLSAVCTPWERGRLSRILENIFEEYPSAAAHRRWLDIAPEIEDTATVELAYELKVAWDETPAFWCFRKGPNSLPDFNESARGQFSWRSAFDVACADPSVPVDELLDLALLDDWRDLPGPCPGYWSFASYVKLIATGDEADTAALKALTRMGRSRSMASFEFEMSAPKVARMHSGVAVGDAAIKLERAYQQWVAKHDAKETSAVTASANLKRKKHAC